MRRILLAALLVLLLAGCAGPKAPLPIAIKEVPSDVVLGKAGSEPALVPIPPIALPVDSRTISVFDTPPGGPFRPAPSPEPCPEANPLVAPRQEAVNTISLPPAAGSYLFRNDGSFEVSGANAKKGSFPLLSRRQVKNVVKITTPGSQEIRYRFDVEVEIASLITTTTYLLVPEQATTPPNDPTGEGDVSSSRAGIFIDRIVSQFPDGSSEDFNPAADLLLLPFPISPGVTWSSAGSDVRSRTTMAFTGTIGQRARIDACGVPLDTWTVRIDGQFGQSEGPGIAISPDTQTRFLAEYAFGTQFGGLSLMDTVDLNRTTQQGSLHQKNSGTINSEPGPPIQDPPGCTAPC